MSKPQTRFVCQACGRVTPAYMGRCPQCSEFGTMQEELVEPEVVAKGRVTGLRRLAPQRLADVRTDGVERLSLPLVEFSRVLGGGIVPGSLVLLGGDPGIGKSTLLLDVAGLVANTHGPVLYISGEESLQQIKMRAERMALKAHDLFLLAETSVETMLAHVQTTRPVLVVVDSIQTCLTEDLKSTAGSITQVRESAARFQELAKSTGVTVFLVGHVTKEGAIAGPRVLEHMVDTVLHLEGDPFYKYRLLRSVKNRFGPTSEVGVFEMTADGMQEVLNPSEAFLAERQVNASGSAIAVTMEGTRPLLVEIQALASPTPFPNPRRTTNGVDYNRLLLLTAVLAQRVKLRVFDKDVFANVIGGLEIREPAADLAIALALSSSIKDRPIHADMAFIGEIGLSGELRAVSQLEARLLEAAKLGFKRCVVPLRQGRQMKQPPAGLQVIGCRLLEEAIRVALVSEGGGSARPLAERDEEE